MENNKKSSESSIYSFDGWNTIEMVDREDSLTKRGSVIEINNVYKSEIYKQSKKTNKCWCCCF